MVDKLDSVINIAEADDNIRGVVLYGSRANKDVPIDQYQDYDIIFITNDKDKFGISTFENVKIKFVPSKVYPELFIGDNTYLLLFDDDSRVDLTVCTMETFISRLANGQPMKCLLDKDEVLDKYIKIDPNSNRIKPMDEETYINTCSEFFGKSKTW